MSRRWVGTIVAGLLILSAISLGCAKTHKRHYGSGQKAAKTSQSVTPTKSVAPDTLVNSQFPDDRYSHLTDADFEKVAKELQIETAAIKAVVSIEAGSAMRGFWAPGVPVINFDGTMYRKYAPTAKNKSGVKDAKVPAGLKGHALSEWTTYINAYRNNAEGAQLGTFWGMFQIGGFNYKRCGCESVQEFVHRMSYSEYEQLALFAAFITNNGFVKDLRSNNWAAFARKYNGPSYAKRGYHTKMAKAYSRFKAEERNQKSATGSDGKMAGKELKVR